MRPKEVHVVLSPSGWAAGRVGNPNFEDGFTQRFSSIDQIAETYRYTHNPNLAFRQVALGWLPSVRSRGPYGQRLLLRLVPPEPYMRQASSTWSVSEWNRAALSEIAKQARSDGAVLSLHMAPYSGESATGLSINKWAEGVSGMARAASLRIPEPWEPQLFRDGVHLHHHEVPRLVDWFNRELAMDASLEANPTSPKR
jgi:hypothetical protein